MGFVKKKQIFIDNIYTCYYKNVDFFSHDLYFIKWLDSQNDRDSHIFARCINALLEKYTSNTTTPDSSITLTSEKVYHKSLNIDLIETNLPLKTIYDQFLLSKNEFLAKKNFRKNGFECE